ncbi:MAG: methyltransferase domain-containing protein [Actinomycetota bacterium]
MAGLIDVLFGLAARLAGARTEKIVAALVAKRAAQVAPAEALRLLLRLDNTLYALTGRYAVAYGGGDHTKHRHTRYFDFFVERCRTGEQVADIGCGGGALAQALAAKGCRVQAVDLSAANIAAARARHDHPGVTWRVGDATTAGTVEPCEVVILSNVLEHIAGRPDFLRRTVAATGAKRLLIRVPLFERDWRVPLKRELGVEHRLDPTHETEYTLAEFEAEMAEADVAIVAAEVHWGEIWAECRPKAP